MKSLIRITMLSAAGSGFREFVDFGAEEWIDYAVEEMNNMTLRVCLLINVAFLVNIILLDEMCNRYK